MIARIRAWWVGRSMLERLLVAIGVPVAAIAALWSARQDRARKAAAAEAAEDGEGGPGNVATVTRAGAAPSQINVGAPGVGTSDLAAFTESFAGEIGSLEDQLAGLEKQFGDTTTERAKEIDRVREELEDRFSALPVGDPVPGPGEDRPAESPKRRNDQERQRKQRQADPDAQLRAAIRQIFREEHLDQPSSGRLARLVEEVKRGRTLASIREGLEAFKANRPELGIPV